MVNYNQQLGTNFFSQNFATTSGAGLTETRGTNMVATNSTAVTLGKDWAARYPQYLQMNKNTLMMNVTPTDFKQLSTSMGGPRHVQAHYGLTDAEITQLSKNSGIYSNNTTKPTTTNNTNTTANTTTTIPTTTTAAPAYNYGGYSTGYNYAQPTYAQPTYAQSYAQPSYGGMSYGMSPGRNWYGY